MKKNDTRGPLLPLLFGTFLAGACSLATAAQNGLPDGAVERVPPLTRAAWNQGRHYNRMCPTTTVESCPDGRMWAGCVAVAAAIVMDHYQWPYRGQTTPKSLNDERNIGTDEITLRARFAQPYDWAAMRETYGHVVSARESLAVGTLLADIGAVLGMAYGTSGSSTQTEKVPGILRDNFHFTYHDYRVVNHPYDDDERALIHAQLQAGHPIVCSGPAGASGKGHSYVCDGWATHTVDNVVSNYYHFNFGWGGTSNGWYPLEAVITQATASDTPQAWPVEDMHIGILPDLAPQFRDISPLAPPELTLDWLYARCWTNAIVRQTLERQELTPIRVEKTFAADDWWVKTPGPYSPDLGWSVENGALSAKTVSSFGSVAWPGWGSVAVASATPIQISAETQIEIDYEARQLPSGVTISLYKATLDPDTDEYANYPLGSLTSYPKVTTLPGGPSATALTARTVTITGAELIKAFGTNETDAHLALVFDDSAGTCPYAGGTEVFRLTALRVNGSAQDWMTVETRPLEKEARTITLSGLAEQPHRFRLTAETADGMTAEAVLIKEVSQSLAAPTVSVTARGERSVTFTVGGATDFTYGFEKQSNALNGTPTKSGSTVTWTFAKPTTEVGTHWLTLSVTNTATGIGTTCVHITNPPVDHPLCSDFEADFKAAIARARRERKLIFLLATGDPDSTKFKNMSGMLSSNEVVTAVHNRYLYTEALTCTADGDTLARRYWRAQPTVPGDTTPATYQPLIMGYAMIIDPNRPDIPYPCDTLPASYFSAASRWNYFNSQYDLANLGYSYYVANRTQELARFLNQEKFVITASPLKGTVPKLLFR